MNEQVEANDLRAQILRNSANRDRARAQLEAETPQHCRACGTMHVDAQRVTQLCNALRQAQLNVERFSQRLTEVQNVIDLLAQRDGVSS